ncbi:MAG TPA: TlpA disulfide reductase family protein [Bacteroidales bacterium]|nr:TlpA disulfide reductase family protein [Bacteroidales bacterium]
MKYTTLISLVAGILFLSSCKNASTPENGAAYKVPEEILAIPEGVTYGLRAPEIELPSINGETMKLSDLQGRIVLLDFWAAWCNPCRMENPNLVKAYAKYHDVSFTEGEGFEIVSVSIDRNESAWKKAVEEDNLSWPYQLSDLEGAKSKAAIDYGITMIPTNFLLDKNGVIIATNLRGELLEEKLESLVKQEK